MNLYNSSRLLRAACKAIDAVRHGQRCTWHPHALRIVISLRNAIKDASTLSEVERTVIGSDIGFLSSLIADYPWLLDGTGFAPRTGRPKTTARITFASGAIAVGIKSKP